MGVTPDIEVIDNPAAGRFEAGVDGGVAVAEYRRENGTIVFTHTEVPRSLRGRGVGEELVRQALEQASRNGLRVVARCPFVRSYIRRHPRYQALLKDAS